MKMKIKIAIIISLIYHVCAEGFFAARNLAVVLPDTYKICGTKKIWRTVIKEKVTIGKCDPISVYKKITNNRELPAANFLSLVLLTESVEKNRPLMPRYW